MQVLRFIDRQHSRTKRDYLKRMLDDKVSCSIIARKYGYEYWDGDRRFGYGGYRFDPGFWDDLTDALGSHYELSPQTSIVDLGCGKGFLLECLAHKFGCRVAGLEWSSYAVHEANQRAHVEVVQGDLRDPLSYPDNSFDLALCTGVLHNFKLVEASRAIREISRISRKQYITVEAHESVEEFFNLQCWALTANLLLSVDDWLWLFESSGYTGDLDFMIFR